MVKVKKAFTLDKEVYEGICKMADEKQRPVSNLINRILTKALEDYKKKGGK
jgi:predicted CopG family antitoxin